MNENYVLTDIIEKVKKSSLGSIVGYDLDESEDQAYYNFVHILQETWLYKPLSVKSGKKVSFKKIKALLLKLYKKDRYKYTWMPQYPILAVKYIKLMELLVKKENHL